MKCKECGGNLSVIETVKTECVVLRKRICNDCRKTFYTRESVDDKACSDYKRHRYLNGLQGKEK